MSDPVTNAEIEDVLSSIRRLVSSGDRDKSPVQVGARTESTDKLVLTPALRVDASNDVDQDDSTPADDNAGVSALGDRFEFRHTPQDDAAETTEQDQDPLPLKQDYKVETDMDPDMSDPGIEAEPMADDEGQGATEEPEPAGHDVDHSDRSEVDAEPSDMDQQADLESLDDKEKSGIAALGDRIAEVEDAVAARDDEWEPDGETDDPYSGSEVTPMAWEDYGPEPAEDEDEPAASGPEVIVAHPSYRRDASSDHPASDDGSAGSASATQPHSDDDATKADAYDPALWSDDGDAIIDEETLRDMVSEIVRQELQGALGERITRNVRKLVRREIHRALTSQEFD